MQAGPSFPFLFVWTDVRHTKQKRMLECGGIQTNANRAKNVQLYKTISVGGKFRRVRQKKHKKEPGFSISPARSSCQRRSERAK